ncbi:MAG TPA: epimerase, partial [Algoriphagus sp.]|nr:epimerase [Algoriphagus sp.]
MNKISIIGLGWLGLPLAKNLQEKGYEVIGSTTTGEKVKKLEAEGITSVQFSLEPYPKGLGFQKLFEAEILVITIPPRSRTQSGERYLEELKFLKSMLQNTSVKKLVFVSSTGIYPEKNQAEKYTEEFEMDLSITGNKTLWKAEQLMNQDKSYELTIVRFGGLMGEERVPGKYFAGKENVEGHSRVNYIHQDDAVGIITWIIEKNLWNET